MVTQIMFTVRINDIFFYLLVLVVILFWETLEWRLSIKPSKGRSGNTHTQRRNTFTLTSQNDGRIREYFTYTWPDPDRG